MRVLNSLDDIPRNLRPVMTMGTFDGLHIGHSTIIDETLRLAREDGAQSLLLTFYPHPREIVRTDDEPVFLLTTIEERVKLLEDMGLDICLIVPFTRDLSLLEAEDYFKGIIVERIAPRHIVVGSDHAFGRGRRGKTEELRRLCKTYGIDVTIIQEVDLAGRKISSTVIRKALATGDVETAHILLGRPYLIQGIVQRGVGLGKEFGFPTANMHLDASQKMLPKIGVYLVRLHWNDRILYGMMNIGRRPTIAPHGDLTVEVHIFQFDEDIYGLPLSVEVMQRIRDEIRFPSNKALIEQLQADKELALDLISTHERTF